MNQTQDRREKQRDSPSGKDAFEEARFPDFWINELISVCFCVEGSLKFQSERKACWVDWIGWYLEEKNSNDEIIALSFWSWCSFHSLVCFKWKLKPVCDNSWKLTCQEMILGSGLVSHCSDWLGCPHKEGRKRPWSRTNPKREWSHHENQRPWELLYYRSGGVVDPDVLYFFFFKADFNPIWVCESDECQPSGKQRPSEAREHAASSTSFWFLEQKRLLPLSRRRLHFFDWKSRNYGFYPFSTEIPMKS